jgi:hypothetical protein
MKMHNEDFQVALEVLTAGTGIGKIVLVLGLRNTKAIRVKDVWQKCAVGGICGYGICSAATPDR